MSAEPTILDSASATIAVAEAAQRARTSRRALELFDEATAAGRPAVYLARACARAEQQRDTIAAAEAQAVRQLAELLDAHGEPRCPTVDELQAAMTESLTAGGILPSPMAVRLCAEAARRLVVQS